MFWKLARKIDAGEMVRVNLRLGQDLVNAVFSPADPEEGLRSRAA
jgi:hypothetical protein